MAEAALTSTTRQEKERASLLQLAKSQSSRPNDIPDWFKTLKVQLVPIVEKAMEFSVFIAPYIREMYVQARAVYLLLPTTAIRMIYGLGVCFFGGMFPLTIAAFETFRVSGGERALTSLNMLADDFMRVHEANVEDNKKDEDGDGVADVKQIGSQQLMTRKLGLFLRTANPERLTQGLYGISQAMAGVVATLKLQFAKTMSLAVSISDNIRKPAVSILAPFLIYSLPPEHHPWINPILDLTCKFLAMSLAWYLSRIISAVHSAIIGGLAASRACIQLLNDRKLITLDIDKSMIDEYSGWTLAAMGILFQLGQGMQLSFPLNILLLPLSFVEVSLQWAVTFMK